MKIKINESQYSNLLSENKLSIIQKLVDKTIIDKYDFICKIIITSPHHYNLQYSANIYFKDIVNSKISPGKYFQMKEDVMNEVWKLIYTFTNEPVSLYQKSC
jgi:hypothetical protein